jgi:hypothetical protein
MQALAFELRLDENELPEAMNGTVSVCHSIRQTVGAAGRSY